MSPVPCNCKGNKKPESLDPNGTVLASAKGGNWKLTTTGGTTYGFPTLVQARAAQSVYGGKIDTAD